jgi:hypothetical protein
MLAREGAMSAHRPYEGRDRFEGRGGGRDRGAGRAGRRRPDGRAGPPGRPGRARGAPFRHPVALAVAADAEGFERLRRHRLYGDGDYASYLRRTELRLRAMRGLGMDVHLRLLEPAGYESFCAERLLAPGDPLAQAAYAADPERAGAALRYTGGRLAALLPVLVAGGRERGCGAAATAALLDAVEGAAGPEAVLRAALRRAARTFLALAAGAGPGRHRAVLPAAGPPGGALAEIGFTSAGGGLTADADAVGVFCLALAAGQLGAGRSPAGLLLYSRAAPGVETVARPEVRAQVRAWRLPPGGAPVPLGAEGAAPWRRVAPEGFRPAVPAAAFPVPEAGGGPGG